MSVVCCQVHVFSSGGSLVQKSSPTECGVSECDREASILRKPWSTKGYCAMGGKKINVRILHDSPIHSASVCNLFCFICVGKLDTRPVQDLLVLPPRVHNYPPATRLIDQDSTVMRRLTTGILSEKCVVRRFRGCANVIVYLHETG
jgi:hypothetical protein